MSSKGDITKMTRAEAIKRGDVQDLQPAPPPPKTGVTPYREKPAKDSR